jgi:hypothetical protein
VTIATVITTSHVIDVMMFITVIAVSLPILGGISVSIVMRIITLGVRTAKISISMMICSQPMMAVTVSRAIVSTKEFVIPVMSIALMG